MAKAASKAPVKPKGERWQLNADYIETCNCDFGCPCNFSGFPTGGHCEAVVAYHIREGRFGRTLLNGLDVVAAYAWPKAIHQGGGTARFYISESATLEQRDALVRIVSGQAQGTGPFAVFAGTVTHLEPPVFGPIEITVAGRKSSVRIPGAVEISLSPFTNPVSGEVQDVRLSLPKGFIFRSAQAAKTLVMKLFGMGPLSFDHSGKNAFFAHVEFQGP